MTRVGIVRHIILDRRLTGWRGLPFAGAAWVAAVGLRMLVDSWVQGVPFLTFFPAVLISGVLLGLGWGGAVLVISALTANFAFQAPFMALSFGAKEIVSSGGFLLFGGLVLAAAEALRGAVVEVDQAARREAELNLELSHRVQNNLTVVQALAEQTRRIHRDSDAFYPAFRDRLLALSTAHKVLSTGGVVHSHLPELAEAALAPFLGDGRISLQGPRCALAPASSVPLVLILHELGTNAMKYGALSTPDGRVTVTWIVEEESCRLAWQEAGGPVVAAPTRVGLGTRLLRPQPGLDAVTLDFLPGGVRSEIAMLGAALTPGRAG